MEESKIQIHTERPRPAYKSVAGRWKALALGLLGLSLLLICLLGWVLKGNLALQNKKLEPNESILKQMMLNNNSSCFGKVKKISGGFSQTFDMSCLDKFQSAKDKENEP